MSETYIIRVEARFEAAHNLREYYGKPEPLHGHSWKVEAKFRCDKLNHEDFGVDYVVVEKAIRDLAKRFDHVYINEVPPFDKMNPTSENIAKWFYQELDKPEVRQEYVLEEVVVWEGPEAYVAYRV
ncbi:MAG: 6-carboxytetrahydropterin synthase QueD [Candidatus Omnitrophica bacterium CG11_big_fil_rev_8_21_14_0_20_45_26]|uniref:6-carboxy-5,6,7,8-tetrahydropterin synthase n=1 Tax=Candidatus Abzuiibacterium crystallinum TaxID=1974748 RepID=A0A2H0LL53_9BACT|nr:MAG: 6-carboxytetrahydropterin synthase QueD [Candidatus Omnitrophica bacterium CG11_big_fil_rev_8_21_14_0_20_45_26]PIW63827.1 MAG: 6-carboxytetrahydropterin synthase QueD [Candidatus Omnitrophica bacterium CG12_big_fil_rev_8_21_14_0_65_45_16]